MVQEAHLISFASSGSRILARLNREGEVEVRASPIVADPHLPLCDAELTPSLGTTAPQEKDVSVRILKEFLHAC